MAYGRNTRRSRYSAGSGRRSFTRSRGRTARRPVRRASRRVGSRRRASSARGQTLRIVIQQAPESALVTSPFDAKTAVARKRATL